MLAFSDKKFYNDLITMLKKVAFSMANEQTEKKMDIELENPADFTSPEELYKDLIRSIRKYHPSDDISLIEKAYKVAHEAHKDQNSPSLCCHHSGRP